MAETTEEYGLCLAEVVNNKIWTFADELALLEKELRLNGVTNNVCANNGVEDDKDGKNFPLKVEGPTEIEAGTEAIYTVTLFDEKDKPKLPRDKKLIKWAFYIDGIEIKDKINDYIRIFCDTNEKQESKTDYLVNTDVKTRTDDIKENAILYALCRIGK